MKQLLLAMLCVFSASIALAQQTVTGRITDSDSGEGLPGVTVVIKGTTSGTATDLDGNYSISVEQGQTLLISYIGYVTQEIVVDTRTTINVSLATDVSELQEVVVVGYGTQDKKEITSAAVVVDASSFNQGAISDPRQLLQGKVPGLSIYNRGGES